MDTKSHWDRIYQARGPTRVSWYRPHLELSLALIEDVAPDHEAQVIDVGGGESTLIDDLLARGYRNLSLLDISSTAIDVAKRQLDKDASRVTWLCGDVTTMPLAVHQFDLWHDRAVFHFLTSPDARAAYVRQVARAVKPGGYVIVATFGPEGPRQCSGLDVVRYDANQLHDEFGGKFQLIKHATELHQTPAGAMQQFLYCLCSISK
jgi:SAM-dependent methyltransferase